jgi:hypothetical protein
MGERLATETWAIDLPDGWSIDRSGERIRLAAPASTARIVVTDLQLELVDATAEIVERSVRAALDAAHVTIERVEDPATSTEDGRLVAVGQGRSEQGFCRAAAHAWPGCIVLLTLFQVDDDAEVARQAAAILEALRRVQAAQPKPSLRSRLLRR